MAVTNIVASNVLLTTSQVNVLAANTTSGVFVFIANLITMAAGDVVELRIFNTINSSTEALAYFAIYAHAQAQPMKYSVPVPSLGGASDTIRMTAVQTAIGTYRTIPFRVVTIG